jgi:putative oxidoreductase
MNPLLRFFLEPPSGPASILLIRFAVGLIFLNQGILKFIDPAMGLLRFTKIGFTPASFTAHFVATFAILSGVLVLLGLATRAATIPLLAVISTAKVITKIPEFFRPTQGGWYSVSDARTDFAMLCSLAFLLATGGGHLAIEARFAHQPVRGAAR